MARTIHLTRTVKQMLFEGYKDPLITMARTLPMIAGTIPAWDKFGWFYTVSKNYFFIYLKIH